MTRPDGDWPRELPMFPLGSVVLPGVGVPLHVFEPRYRALVMTCLTSDRLFGSVLIERGSEVGGGDARADVGTLVRIADAEEAEDGRWAVVGLGLERIRVLEWLPDDPFPRCVADPWPDEPPGPGASASLHATRSRLEALLVELGADPHRALLESVADDVALASFQLLALSPIGALDRLEALGAPGPDERLRILDAALEDRAAMIRDLRALDEPGSAGS